MVTVPINLTGGTYQHKSIPLSAQVTRNFWPQQQPTEKGKSKYILEGYPGKKLFGTTTLGTDRGMFEHQGILYKVTGTTLYSVNSSGTHTSLGTIPGVERCIFAPIGSNIVIEHATVRYQWDGSTLTQITDTDLEAGNGIATLNNQIIYGGLNGRFGVSDVGNATSINGLNYATAESDADALLRPYTFNQVLYLFGQKTTELWWNSGEGNPPFSRFEGGIIRNGLGAFHSIANTDDTMFFLGNDGQAYALKGGASAVVKPIATGMLVREWKQYSDISDAIGYCVQINEQWFWILTFPTGNKTWAYPIGGEWFELSSGISGGRDIGNSHAYAFGKNLIADYRNGNIYELDDETYSDNGETIVRQRDTGYIHGGLLNAPGKEIEMHRFELILSKGDALISGQGSDPVVMLSFSDDGGRTFCTEMWATVGKLGKFNWKVEWFGLGRFESRIMRIRVSDPIYWSIFSAAADMEVCI